jgi:hypothetical protein
MTITSWSFLRRTRLNMRIVSRVGMTIALVALPSMAVLNGETNSNDKGRASQVIHAVLVWDILAMWVQRTTLEIILRLSAASSPWRVGRLTAAWPSLAKLLIPKLAPAHASIFSTCRVAR